MNIPVLILGIAGIALGVISTVYIVISLFATLIWKGIQYAKGNRDIL